MGKLEKLMDVVAELKIPKKQWNSFGKFNFRSHEDILEAVKPLLKKHRCALLEDDEITEVGGRVYVKATAAFYDLDDGGKIEAHGWAREAAEKKGMDESQVTGTASSYARKYALSALFLIDDTKDADTDEHRGGGKEPTLAELVDAVSESLGVSVESVQRKVKSALGADASEKLPRDMLGDAAAVAKLMLKTGSLEVSVG